MTGPDLKPCPVCRGPAHLYRADDVACRDAKCLGYKFRHVTTEQWNRRATDQATPAALPEVQALISAAYEVAAHWIEAVPQSLPARDEYARHIRRLTPAEAIAARDDRDAQMRAEGRVAGLREAADIAGLNAWKHAGEDDYSRGMDAGAIHQVKACCDAIRAHADKIEGDTVKTGGHNRECGE